MPNFTGLTPSINQLISASALYGSFNANYCIRPTGNTQFTTINTGLVNYRKFQIAITVPNYSSPVLGYLLTVPSININATSVTIIGLEYLLGSINLANNVFTSGISMPTKNIRGETIQTAANIIFAHMQTASTGTNLSVTLNYTNEDGVTNRTCTITPSTSAITNTTAIDVSKSLQTGDYGIRSIEGITESGGTAGILDFYGILPLAFVSNNTSTSGSTFLNFLNSALPPYLIQTNEKIGVYSVIQNSTSPQNMFLNLLFLPEV